MPRAFLEIHRSRPLSAAFGHGAGRAMRPRRWPVSPPSEGARLLRELAAGATLRALARRALCDESTVARYVTGARVPCASLRAALERRLGIPAGAWDAPPGVTG